MKRLFNGGLLLIALGVVCSHSQLASAQLIPPGSETPEVKPLKDWSGFSEWTTAVEFSPNGGRVAVGTYEAVELLSFSDEDAADKRQKIDLKAGYIRALAYSPDGKTLAAGGYQTVALIDTATREVRPLKGQRGYVLGVAFSPDGQWLVTAAEDETARIWAVADGAEQTVFDRHRLPATAAAFSPDGALVCSADGDTEQPRKRGTAYLWDPKTGEVQAALKGHERGINCVCFSHDGKLVITGSIDETIKAWATADGKLLHTLEGHSRPVNGVAMSPDGSFLVSAGGGRFQGRNNLLFWETKTWELSATIEAHESQVTDVAVSPDGKQVASTSYDKHVRLWAVPEKSAEEKPE